MSIFQILPRRPFRCPTLGDYLAGLAEELRVGRGFLLLRGLPRERWSLDDTARVYYGLGAHIGRPAPQSYLGELLGHVIDVSDIEADARGYHKGGAQRMHTDNCDIVSLTCVRSARSGGISRFVSAAAVHNRLLEERPDLLETLYGDYVFRRMERDAEFGDGNLVRNVVIYSRESGQLTCNVSGSYPHRAVKAGDCGDEPAPDRGVGGNEAHQHGARPDARHDDRAKAISNSSTTARSCMAAPATRIGQRWRGGGI